MCSSDLQNSLPQIKQEHPQLKKVHSHTLQDVAKRAYETWQKNKELKKFTGELSTSNVCFVLA